MEAKAKPFRIVRQGDVDIVRLTESKMEQQALEALQHELARRIDAGARKMVINLAPVAFVDSFGIGVIAAAARQMSEAGGALRLCGVGQRVQMSLTITRLDRTVTILADEDEALRSFGGQG
jgi:anti-anti-sigma factor